MALQQQTVNKVPDRQALFWSKSECFVGRKHVCVDAWILNNCSWPFRQPQIKDYLGLDEREAKALLTMAESERQKLNEQIATLDRQTFQEVCEKIPVPGRLNIQRLFADVW